MPGSQMRHLSPAGIAVLSDMSISSQRPRVLYSAVEAERVPHEDLPELIAFAWLHDDSPTAELTEAEWLSILAITGFFSYPQPRQRPNQASIIYRGTSPDRRYRMSWADSEEMAVTLGTRHAWHGPTALYRAIIEPGKILAYLHRPGEGWTVLVNPAALRDVQEAARSASIALGPKPRRTGSKPMRNQSPVPPDAKVLDSASLLALEHRAAELGLSQRLPRTWLESHLARAGRHYLRPALWHSLSHRPEVSPHLRCELLIELHDDNHVHSLIDAMPQDYEQLPSVTTRAEYLAMADNMAAAQTVKEYDERPQRT